MHLRILYSSLCVCTKDGPQGFANAKCIFIMSNIFFDILFPLLRNLSLGYIKTNFWERGKKTELIIEKKVTIIWATTEPREYILIIEKF